MTWPRWLRRDLLLLLAARGLRSLSQAYLNIIVPIYLARLGFSAVDLGLLLSASAVSSALLTASVGLFSDRWGRKLSLIALALLTSAGALVFALSTNYLALLTAAAISTLGRGGAAGSGGAWGPYYPAEQALIAEQVSPRDRTTAFGAVSFVGVLAGALGSLVALLPRAWQSSLGLSLLEGDRLLFLVTVGLGIATALAVVPVQERAPANRPHPAAGSRWVPLSEPTVVLVLRFAATNFINGLAIGFLGPLLVYWFHQRYGVAGAELGVLFFLVNLAVAPSYLYADRIARRLGDVNAVVVTRAVSVVLLAMLAFAPTYPVAAAIYLLRMVTGTLSIPVRQSYLMGVIDPNERATAAGLSSLPSQVAGSLSPTAAGWFMQSVSLSLPLLAAAVLQGVNVALFFVFFHRVNVLDERGPGTEAGGRAG